MCSRLGCEGVCVASGQLALGVKIKLHFLLLLCEAGMEAFDQTGRPKGVWVPLCNLSSKPCTPCKSISS